MGLHGRIWTRTRACVRACVREERERERERERGRGRERERERERQREREREGGGVIENETLNAGKTKIYYQLLTPCLARGVSE